MESTDRQLPQRLVLAGFMGAGKSTVGSRVADVLDWRFVDLDEEIVRAQGASISSLFLSMGEAAFRALEHTALAQALQQNTIVLALGGGTMESESSRALLMGDPATLLVYLEAPLEVLLSRCELQSLSLSGAAARPVLDDREGIAERFLRRKPFYQAAHWHVDTVGRGAAQVASEILGRWKQLHASGDWRGDGGHRP